MSLKTISRWMLVIGCVGAVPLYAQTTATTATTTTKTETHMKHMQHKATTEAKETKAEVKKETKAEEKKETKVEEKKETRMTHHRMARSMRPSRLTTDATRLAAILDDTQSNANVSSAVWKTTANEANTLMNRVYASARTATEKKAAREARMHVREMRSAAMKDDAAAAKSHAAQALPFVYQIIDASAPK